MSFGDLILTVVKVVVMTGLVIGIVGAIVLWLAIILRFLGALIFVVVICALPGVVGSFVLWFVLLFGVPGKAGLA